MNDYLSRHYQSQMLLINTSMSNQRLGASDSKNNYPTSDDEKATSKYDQKLKKAEE